MALRDGFRSMLGIRTERATPRRTSRPAIGAKICRDDLRITVQAGLSDDLWLWLQDQGWRVVTFRPDRRRYRDIPHGWVTRLIDAPPEERVKVHAAAVVAARVRRA